MKSIAVAACVLFAASLLQAQTTPTTPSAPTTSTTKPVDVTPAPAAPAPAKNAKAAPVVKKDDKKKDEKKKEELPPIPGTTINRANGTFLGLEVIDGNFKLSFYDKKHKLMTVDVTRATARWPNMKSATPGQFRTVLNGSGTALVGQRAVQPPYTFNVFITLLQGEGDDAKAVENYTVPLKG